LRHAPRLYMHFIQLNFIHLNVRCASGCVVECRICNREVAGSNLNLSYFAPRSTQPSIPPGSVNEYTSCGWEGKGRYGSFRLRMNVWVCRQNCEIPWEHVPYLSASAVVIHYEEALYQMYAPLHLPIPKVYFWVRFCVSFFNRATLIVLRYVVFLRVFFHLSSGLVVNTSANDWLERLVYETDGDITRSIAFTART